MSDLVPFGKHKGKPVEALLDDREYLDWLLSQGWFQQRYGNLYQVVINNGQQPTETPEHNAMQIKFLDEAYRLKFAVAVYGGGILEFASNNAVREGWKQVVEISRRLMADFKKDEAVEYAAAVRQYQEKLREFKIATAECDKCRSGKNATCYSHDEPKKPERGSFAIPKIRCEGSHKSLARGEQFGRRLVVSPSPKFEVESIDVEYALDLGFDFHPYELETHKRKPGSYSKIVVDLPTHCRSYSFAIEIKPSVGDDYPAILRQVQRNKSKYLLIRSYNGIGATEGQFVEFFKSQGIKVIFESDVDAVVLPVVDREIDDIKIVGALNLLSRLRSCDIHILRLPCQIHLHAEGPTGSVTNELCAEIQELKLELLELVPSSPSELLCEECYLEETCRWCGSLKGADGDCPNWPGCVPF